MRGASRHVHVGDKATVRLGRISRQYLKRFSEALTLLENAPKGNLGGFEGEKFAERFLTGLAVTRSIIELLLANPSISSDMEDNANSLVNVWAFLTDVFFIDQALLPRR